MLYCDDGRHSVQFFYDVPCTLEPITDMDDGDRTTFHREVGPLEHEYSQVTSGDYSSNFIERRGAPRLPQAHRPTGPRVALPEPHNLSSTRCSTSTASSVDE